MAVCVLHKLNVLCLCINTSSLWAMLYTVNCLCMLTRTSISVRLRMWTSLRAMLYTENYLYTVNYLCMLTEVKSLYTSGCEQEHTQLSVDFIDRLCWAIMLLGRLIAKSVLHICAPQDMDIPEGYAGLCCMLLRQTRNEECLPYLAVHLRM